MKMRTKKAKSKRRNPLRMDPTRTTTLRRSFLAVIRRRFGRFKLALVKLVLDDDVFGLKPRHVITANAPQEWRFRTSPEKLKAFAEWLRNQFRSDIVGLTDEQLWRAFVEAGFRKGAGRAYDDTTRAERIRDMTERLDFYAGTREQFLRDSFARPETVEKVQLLASRTFEDLKNVTEDMATKMGRVLASGLVQGKGPAAVARDLTAQLDLSRQRAELIARTELIRAHAEGQLTAFDNLGVEELGVSAEWSTAGDGRVCHLCAPLEGVVFKMDEARGMIPRHPNCRCTWIPAGVGERRDDQKRTQASVKSAIQASRSRDDSDWGPAVPIAADRPRPIINSDLATFSRLLRGDRLGR